ncbi:DUF3455 domain-containing protein [Luteitalea pratensis]|nr:DUF3455 domain-containing protein [Luteitalea pratensis]
MIWKHSAAAILAVLAHTSIAHAQGAVPGGLEVPAGHAPFLTAHAEGTQNYVCVLAPDGFGWQFHGPQATLANDAMTQVATHFLSPNPIEGGAARATWQHSADTSRVWAVAIANSTDAAFVAPGAIPWLLLKVVGQQGGPGGGTTLSGALFIQRTNTAGGQAPPTGCKTAQDVGRKALVPYEADYVFYQ